MGRRPLQQQYLVAIAIDQNVTILLENSLLLAMAIEILHCYNQHSYIFDLSYNWLAKCNQPMSFCRNS